MAIELSTAGITLSWKAESVAGTRPTTGYAQLEGLKEIPDLAPAPESLETTTLDATEYKTYINGLKDLGGALGFNFNMTQSFVADWDALISGYTSAKASGLAIWFKIYVPGLTKAVYFTGIPSELGMPGVSVNAVLEITAYITQSSGLLWA